MELNKDLDDVIKAVKICKSDAGCNKCPYYKANSKHSCFAQEGNRLLEDVYVYLKRYQKEVLGCNH